MTFEVRRGLIIEDNPSMVLMIHSTFTEPAWNLDFAMTFEEAIDKIEQVQNGYDFILADLNLPYSTTDLKFKPPEEMLRDLNKATKGPIIVTSGYDLDWLEQRQAEFGVYGILRKGSWRAYRVRDVIEGAIAKWRVDRYEKVTEILREEHTKWRREFLGHES